MRGCLVFCKRQLALKAYDGRGGSQRAVSFRRGGPTPSRRAMPRHSGRIAARDCHACTFTSRDIRSRQRPFPLNWCITPEFITLPVTMRRSSMRYRIRLAAGAVALAAGALALAGPAAAQGGVKVGSLTCNVASGWGFVFGSSRGLNCTFSGPLGIEYYTGAISKFGVDIGYTAGGVMIWTVIAPK